MTEQEQDNGRAKRRLSWARLLLATGAILVLLPCLGLVGSATYLKSWRAGSQSRWRSLGAPPDGGAEIVTGDRDVVYVRTATGSIYGCEHRSSSAPGNCWIEAEGPLSVDPEARFDRRLYKGEVEPPTGTVVDTLDVTVWYAEDAFETLYFLLEDGTVWKWDYDVGSYWTLVILFLGPLAGAAAGIAIAVVLWGVAGLRGLRRRIRQRGDAQG